MPENNDVTDRVKNEIDNKIFTIKSKVTKILENEPESVSYEAIDANRLNDEIWNSDKIIPVKINDGLTIKINPAPSIEEKIAFIKKVVDDSFIDNTEVYFTRTKALYDVLYLIMFTDYNFPDTVKTKAGQVDIDSAYNHLQKYNLDEIFKQFSNQRTELWKDCKQRIEAEQAKRIALLSHNYELEETVENINTLIKSVTVFFANASMKMTDIPPEVINNVVNLFGANKK